MLGCASLPSSHASLPVAVSLGDPAGIGPEVVVRALARRPGAPVRVFGDRGVIERAAGRLDLTWAPAHEIVEVTRLPPADARPGEPGLAAGRAQIEYLARATDAALAGQVAALVTAPISKTWAARAGFAHPGHTEYLATRAGVTEVAMMMVGPRLRVTLATTHVPLARVADLLTPAAVSSAAVLTAQFLRDLGVAEPRVAVAGWNPHAGEAGQFGDEEARIVAPGIRMAERRLAERGLHARLSGPAVPDVVFRQAAGGAFDAVVALYHDQGLIPVKLDAFDRTVNVTLGLPFPRTSPDHGTAHDIAGRCAAREDSFLAAFDLARELAARVPSGAHAAR